MSDRELLELAAKAAGIDYRHDNAYWTHEDHCAFWSYDDLCNCGARWNPLTDDGDALRLAVKLQLLGGEDFCLVTAMHESGDPYAATRRAITRAAAEIGRNMK